MAKGRTIRPKSLPKPRNFAKSPEKRSRSGPGRTVKYTSKRQAI